MWMAVKSAVSVSGCVGWCAGVGGKIDNGTKQSTKKKVSERTKVAAYVVSGSIGPRCSHSAQVDGPAYQLHEPAGEKQTRHNQTSQLQNTL